MPRRGAQTTPYEFEVVIIGAGFAGLGMGIRLKQAGQDSFIILERAGDVGGTWRDNVYPGCACDIPSLVYSFSFDQNSEWSRKFPTQPEIFEYLKHSADKFGLRPHIRLHAAVTDLAFDEVNGCWEVRIDNGDILTARFVVAAMGPLNRPYIPEIPGRDVFLGRIFHSSAWETDFDPAGKRIATIGTGASAIQFIPELAKTAARLHVFQRTPPWILPRGDHAVSPARNRLFRQLPLLQRAARGLLYWRLEIGVLSFLGNKLLNRLATHAAQAHLKAAIPDPELRLAVTPQYQIGCKRVLLSDNYYPALQQENVELVTCGIREIGAQSIVDGFGRERPLDAIIFGTGFVAAEFLVDMRVRGRNGRELLGEWKETGPEAYFGTSVSGYPNLFFLLGPNTGLGHNSVVLMMESQYNYIFDYMRLLREKGVPFLDLKPEAQAAHNAEIQQKLATTVWQAGGCRSWYQTGWGKNTTIWPGSTVGYRLQTRRVHGEAYELEEWKSR